MATRRLRPALARKRGRSWLSVLGILSIRDFASAEFGSDAIGVGWRGNRDVFPFPAFVVGSDRICGLPSRRPRWLGFMLDRSWGRGVRAWLLALLREVKLLNQVLCDKLWGLFSPIARKIQRFLMSLTERCKGSLL